MSIYWRDALNKNDFGANNCSGHISGQVSDYVFCCKLKLVRASRRFSLLQTLCARQYEKRTQQAELVGKISSRGGASKAWRGRQ